MVDSLHAHIDAHVMARWIPDPELRLLAHNALNPRDRLFLSRPLLQRQTTLTIQKRPCETDMRAKDLIIPDEKELEQIERWADTQLRLLDDPHDSLNCILCQIGPKPLSVAEEEIE